MVHPMYTLVSPPPPTVLPFTGVNYIDVSVTFLSSRLMFDIGDKKKIDLAVFGRCLFHWFLDELECCTSPNKVHVMKRV